MKFQDLLDKLRDIEFTTVFPLHDKDLDVKNLLINVGIYLGIIIAAIMLIVLLGEVVVLGVILWIIGVIAIGYSLVGMFADLLKFMKYN